MMSGAVTASLPVRPWAYGALGLPLAFAALPLYLHLPHYYASVTDLSLAWLGAFLLLARLGDALLDPWLGHGVDRYGGPAWLLGALALFGAGFVALLHPPAENAGLWLMVCLCLTYLGFSAATIAYQAWGAALGQGEGARQNRLTASREAYTLAGVILAASLPAVLSPVLTDGVASLAWVLPPLLLLGALLALGGGGPWPVRGAAPAEDSLLAGLRAVLAHGPMARLLGVFVVNGLAAALPATLFLFFVSDRLGADQAAGPLLALYFIAAALAMPLWVRLAARQGRCRAWAAGMGVALLGFLGAIFVGPGEVTLFAAVCLASGLGLGADLVLPAALAADFGQALKRPGAVFGLWNFVAKLNLGLAAGLALPWLAWLGYQPGTGEGLLALHWTYAGLPLVLKAWALGMLWRFRHVLEVKS